MNRKASSADLEAAEVFFREMGCSHFHMSRDDPARFAEYVAVGVSEGQEASWRQAEFDQKLADLVAGAVSPDRLWALHSYLEDLAETIRRPDVLCRLYEATEQLVPVVPSRTRILVAETLVGRGRILETGPIHLALALGDATLAMRFSELVPKFCDGRSAPRGGPPLPARRAAVLERLDTLMRATPSQKESARQEPR